MGWPSGSTAIAESTVPGAVPDTTLPCTPQHSTGRHNTTCQRQRPEENDTALMPKTFPSNQGQPRYPSSMRQGGWSECSCE